MTKYLLIISLYMLTSCTSSTSWTCDGNCQDGIGKKNWKDGGIDSGKWKSGNQEGKGKQVFGSTSQFSGDIYEGELKEGLYHGFGVYRDVSENNFYTGEFKSGDPHGYGKLVFNENSKHPTKYYDGYWKKGLYDSLGTLFWGQNGKYAHDKYFGQWSSGQMHGYGKYFWANGDKYEGPWFKNKQHGDGLYIFKNGDTIKGHWDNGYCQELAKRRGLE